MENKEATVRVFDTRENVQYSSYLNKMQDIKSAIVIHDNGKGDFLLSKHNLETREESTGMNIDGNIDDKARVTRMHNKGLYEISKRKAILLSELPVDSLRFKAVLKSVILTSPDLTKLEASRESQNAIYEIMDKGRDLAKTAIDNKLKEERQKEEQKRKQKQDRKQEKEGKFVETVLNKFKGNGKE